MSDPRLDDLRAQLARNDYPWMAFLSVTPGRPLQIHREELVGALAEIDALRLRVAWLENIAASRGEENEELRRDNLKLRTQGRSIDRLPGHPFSCGCVRCKP